MVGSAVVGIGRQLVGNSVCPMTVTGQSLLQMAVLDVFELRAASGHLVSLDAFC